MMLEALNSIYGKMWVVVQIHDMAHDLIVVQMVDEGST